MSYFESAIRALFHEKFDRLLKRKQKCRLQWRWYFLFAGKTLQRRKIRKYVRVVSFFTFYGALYCQHLRQVLLRLYEWKNCEENFFKTVRHSYRKLWNILRELVRFLVYSVVYASFLGYFPTLPKLVLRFIHYPIFSFVLSFLVPSYIFKSSFEKLDFTRFSSRIILLGIP